MGCTSSSLTMTDLPSSVIPVTILRIVRSSFAYWAAAPSVFPLPAGLVQPHRVLEALRHELPAVAEVEPLAGTQPAHRVRHQYPPTLSFRRDPRGEDDGGAKQVALFLDGLAGIQADADRQWFALAPSERPLQRHRALHRLRHAAKGSHEAVTHSFHFGAPVLLEDIAGDAL